MRYVVDRVEEDIAVLECISNKEKKEVNKSILPEDIRDGSIVIFNNDKYILDKSFEEERRESIRNKFNKLVGKKHE